MPPAIIDASSLFAVTLMLSPRRFSRLQPSFRAFFFFSAFFRLRLRYAIADAYAADADAAYAATPD